MPDDLIVGLVWYTPDDYARALEVMDDRKDLQDTWTEWARDAEDIERELAANGQVVKRVFLKPDQFVAWCAVRGLKRDGKARAEWVSQAARAIGR